MSENPKAPEGPFDRKLHSSFGDEAKAAKRDRKSLERFVPFGSPQPFGTAQVDPADRKMKPPASTMYKKTTPKIDFRP